MFPHFDQSEYAVALQNAYRQFPAKDSTLDIDFINNRSRVAGVQGAALDGVTFTRSTTGRYIDDTATLQTAAIDVARFEYDQLILRPLGLLAEGSRSNVIRNNTMLGAVAGAPGTLPTNWVFVAGTSALSTQVVGTGTALGIPYIDIRFYGTAGATTGASLRYHGPTDSAALTGQLWSQGTWIGIVAGTLNGVSSFDHSYFEQNSGGSFVTTTGAYLFNSIQPWQRYVTTITTRGGATTAYITPGLRIGVTAGATVDVTVRIGLPQLEQGDSSTSVIETAGSTATRGADVISMTGADFSKWFTAGAGTLFVRAMLKGIGSTTPIIQLDDGTGNEIISVRGNSTDPELYIVDGGVTQAQLDGGTLSANTYTNIAVSWAENDAAISQNGGPVMADDSATLPTVTQMRLGSDGTNYINGHIARATYWPYRLPNPLLQYLSRLTA